MASLEVKRTAAAMIYCAKERPGGKQTCLNKALSEMDSGQPFNDSVLAYAASLDKVEASGHEQAFKSTTEEIVKAMMMTSKFQTWGKKKLFRFGSKLVLATMLAQEMAKVKSPSTNLVRVHPYMVFCCLSLL